MKTKWTVDVAPDAAGFRTIRPADGTCYGDTDQQPIATVYTEQHAPLIAAAPDLLAALDACVEGMRDTFERMGGTGYQKAVAASEQARAAIAKARGAA
jgi:hypothetical protein